MSPEWQTDKQNHATSGESPNQIDGDQLKDPLICHLRMVRSGGATGETSTPFRLPARKNTDNMEKHGEVLPERRKRFLKRLTSFYGKPGFPVHKAPLRGSSSPECVPKKR